MSSPETQELYCPKCRQPTDSLKQEDVLIFLSLVIYFVWHTEKVVACPACMRSHALMRLGMSLPMSNLFFPLISPFYVYYMLNSHRKGHTVPAGDQDRYLTQPPERVAKPAASPLRFVIIGLVFLSAIVFTLIMAAMSQE